MCRPDRAMFFVNSIDAWTSQERIECTKCGVCLHSDSEKSSLKNLVKWTEFFVYFKLDFGWLAGSKIQVGNRQKKNQVRLTRNFKIQVQINRGWFKMHIFFLNTFWLIVNSWEAIWSQLKNAETLTKKLHSINWARLHLNQFCYL